jgi:hypothetical protein
LEHISQGAEGLFGKGTKKRREQSEITLRSAFFHMEYKRFRDKGWPTGSGPVKGACKNIVKQRMCRSGMRWSIKADKRY